MTCRLLPVRCAVVLGCFFAELLCLCYGFAVRKLGFWLIGFAFWTGRCFWLVWFSVLMVVYAFAFGYLIVFIDCYLWVSFWF